MKRPLVAALFALATVPLATGAALGAPRKCAARALMLEHLNDRYGESRRSIGLAADNRVIEIFASDETGTWTITVTTPAGLTCLVAAGRAFEALDEKVRPASAAET